MPRSLREASPAVAGRTLALTFLAIAGASLARPAFAADPTTAECVRLNEGAAPLQKAGKVIEAHANLVRCSASTCPAVVRDDCARAAVQTESAIPTIVFEVRDTTGSDLSRVHLAIDGQPRSDKLEGGPLEVNPGEHVFHFEAEGYAPVDRHLVVHAAEKNRLERVQLVSTTAPPPPPKPSPPPPPPPAATSPLRPAGLVIGGVGVAGLIVGGIFGWTAHTTWNRAVSECGGGCPDGSSARDLSTTAHRDGTISTIAFVAGGALTAGGLVMFLASPKGTPTTGLRWAPVVGPTFAGISAGWATP